MIPQVTPHDKDVTSRATTLEPLLDASRSCFQPLAWPHPVLLNSLFKSGTHILSNILTHFCYGGRQNHSPYLFDDQIYQTRELLADPLGPRFFIGHLAWIPGVIEYVRPFRMLHLYRDPRTWILAVGRQYFDPEARGNLAQWVRENRVPLADLVDILLTGGTFFGERLEPIAETYNRRVIPWLSRAAIAIRYCDLVRHATNLNRSESEQFFRMLLAACGLELPANWQARVRAGASRELSATDSRAFMDPALDCQELSAAQKQALEIAAPGLRQVLGFTD